VWEAFYRPGIRASDISDPRSDISDQSDIFSLNRIYPAQSDLAEILQKTEIGRMYPS
jgi:hypothetical protein